VNTGIGAYRTAQSAQEAYQSIQSGSGFKPTVTITYGEQRNTAGQHNSGNRLTPGSIQAGGQVYLNAAGAGQGSTLTVTGSDIAGKQGTTLKAEGNITLQSAAEQQQQHNRSREAGFNAGVALSFDGGLSLGVTAGGNYGQGRGAGERTQHRHSRIGSSQSRTEIQSGGHTAVHGAQVAGSGIGLESRSLSIVSPQDTAAYDGKNYRIEAQVTAGYGFSASGSAEYGSIGADHRSTTLQSGLFAGDDGFQANIKEHTDLKGGIITATEAAEQNGRNRFQTATLSHSD
ncbi:hemagglutinin repeat-containing protein, partial [Neisseria dentiae]|uniref:hemagglutinin repeat-containing protein n=1 Tax=Neisseria dentiae TaxID=194197 RepID=UPI00211BAB78